MIHVGLDVHKYFSQLEVMDEEGTTLERRRFYHSNKAAIQDYSTTFWKSLVKSSW